MNTQTFTTILAAAVAVASLTFAGTTTLIQVTTPEPDVATVEKLAEAEETIALLEERVAVAERDAEQAETNAKWSSCIYWLGGWSQGNGYAYTAAERAWACQLEGSFNSYKVLEYGTGIYE